MAVVRLGVVAAKETKLFKTPKYWAIGKKRSADEVTAKCMGRIWRIRKTVDSYYADNRKIPDNMGVLYVGGFLKERLVCPATGNEYIFKWTESGRF